MPKCDFNNVALANLFQSHFWHECSSVNLLDIFRTPFHKNTSGWLFLFVRVWIF